MTKLIDLKGKLQVGQRVKEVRGGNKSDCEELHNRRGAIITKIFEASVEFNGCLHVWDANIELDIPLTKTWETLEVGDEVVSTVGYTRKVLARINDVIILSYWKGYSSDWDTSISNIRHIEEAKRDGWKIVGATESVETIEVAGKKYNKADVEERLKDLPTVE